VAGLFTKLDKMNNYDVKRLAFILAIQAEIEGMKAENKYREINGHDLTYGDGDFEVKATELRNLAYTHDENL
jgi:hypothetical protein